MSKSSLAMAYRAHQCVGDRFSTAAAARPAAPFHACRHPDAVEIAACHGERRRAARPQFGDQFRVPGPALRHGVDPPPHVAVDGS